MAAELAWIIGSVLATSLVSVLAIFMLRIREENVFWLVSFAAGSLLAAAFIDLLPEATEASGNAFAYALIGVVFFFVLERFLYWHHHHIKHEKREKIHSLAYLVLIGDGIHNFIDGTVIAASFLVDIRVGMAATLAIILHEIPQELGDAGILIYSGMSRLKAAFFNFLSALTALFGAILAYMFSATIDWLAVFLISFAAGGFIYVAAGDLLPELRKEVDIRKSSIQLLLFIMGIAAISTIKYAGGA
ncbi:ZIP family metal transporter [Candidatus Woesearchaeota archaeon]|nr:ZIP family metal transporter [Candidatus Woesearchaeota archaeon]